MLIWLSAEPSRTCALLPNARLLLPVTIADPAPLPMAVLPLPIVLEMRALSPFATFSPPVVLLISA